MRYGIGLDIGIASVGSAVVMLDDENEPCKILKLGSRVFDKAEEDDGSSLAASRRINRGIRRSIRRRRHRKERIRMLICSEMSVDEHYIASLFDQENLSDIYEIRYDAINRMLLKDEFIRLLIHLSQRRGFKSNRKADIKEADKKSEEGALLSAVNANNELMQSKGYRTIGEMIFLDEKFSNFKRNKCGNYFNTFLRSDYEKEVKLIFKTQRELSNPYSTEEFEQKYLSILLSQRSFDEGPGGTGKYSGNQIVKMLRKCTFEPSEYRAPKASFSFEYFTLLCKINSIKIQSGSAKRSLTAEERSIIKELAFNQKELTYLSLRKALKLSDDESFNISYASSDVVKNKSNDLLQARNAVEKKTKFSFIKAYHVFKKIYGDIFDKWETDKRNKLAFILTVYKTDASITEQLSEAGFTDEEIAKALTIPAFAKFGNLSCRAMDNMIPFLEEGYLYNDAAEKAGYNFKANDRCASMYLPTRAYIPPEHRKGDNQICAPELDDIVNPVVRRSVSQTIKVVNAIIREMGESPVYVNIELARNLAKSYAERNKIQKQQEKNQKLNDEIMDDLRSEFPLSNPSGQDLIKLKLWKEQNGICMYSGEPIPRERLFEKGFAEIDHIIPYSISFDDSYNNKVLVLAKENQNKSNRLPLEYMNNAQADKFRVRVETSNLSYRKKKNLMKESITDEDFSGFKQRNLQDTRYICRFMANFIKKYLLFADKPRVVAVNGAATSYIRKRWGIQKIRADGDTHHAVDACVIACTTQGMVQKISLYSKYKETEYKGPKNKGARYKESEYVDDSGKMYDIDLKTGELIDRFPQPYPTFRKELEMLTSNDPMRIFRQIALPNYSGYEQLKPIFVSRMPKRKVTAAAHKETIRGKYEKNGTRYTVQKVALTNLKLNKKTGEIENYFNPQDDALLYNALKQRLALFDGDGQKAFAEPFYKPKSDGTPGPLVKKVKTIEKATLSVDVNQKTAVADNASMIRVDVFYIDGEGYYLVPIYEADRVKDDLPNRAIIRGKPKDEWKVMDESDFIFSLYPSDLIKVQFTRDKKFDLVNNNSTLPKTHIAKEAFLYYRATDISTAVIKGILHDNTYSVRTGVKTLLSIEKYNVDVLGNISKVNKEKRMRF